jgi:Transposase, Mutator family
MVMPVCPQQHTQIAVNQRLNQENQMTARNEFYPQEIRFPLVSPSPKSCPLAIRRFFQGIAMAPTPAIWSLLQVASRRSTCLETVKGSSIPRSLTATVAMNVHIADGLTQMFVAGTSIHKVGEVAQTLMGVAPSASTISRLTQSLTQQCDTWRQRPLQEHWRILYAGRWCISAFVMATRLMPPSF